MSTPLRSNHPECLVLSAAETAQILGISVRHFWACHASGKLGPRPISLGRSKRWRVEEVHAWLAAGAPPRDKWDERQANSPSVQLGDAEDSRD